MNKNIEHNQKTFAPQHYKNFHGALSAFFQHECPQLGGIRTRQVLVQSISEMVNQFYPQTNHLRPGQTPWTAVHKDARGRYGKKIEQTQLQPVILDIIKQDDARERANGKKLRDIKQEATARLFTQAYEQDAVLTNAEVAILLKISPSTVSKYVKTWEESSGNVLPRRGTIHDMGPTLTHKKIIIHKLFIEQKSVQQVSRETYHSFQAIQNYIDMFRRVVLCKKKGMNTEEIAYSVKKSQRLIKQYEEIIDNYGKESQTLKRLLEHKTEIR